MNDIPLNYKKQTNNINFVFDNLEKDINESYESYVKIKLEKLGIIVKKSNEINGHPDFICNYKGKEFYIEVKGNNDGLRNNQIGWMLKNKDKLIYVYYVILRKKKKYVKLQSQISRIYKNKGYKKYWIILPMRILEELKWKGNDELDYEIKKGILLIKKDNKKCKY